MVNSPLCYPVPKTGTSGATGAPRTHMVGTHTHGSWPAHQHLLQGIQQWRCQRPTWAAAIAMGLALLYAGHI